MAAERAIHLFISEAISINGHSHLVPFHFISFIQKIMGQQSTHKLPIRKNPRSVATLGVLVIQTLKLALGQRGIRRNG